MLSVNHSPGNVGISRVVEHSATKLLSNGGISDFVGRRCVLEIQDGSQITGSTNNLAGFTDTHPSTEDKPNDCCDNDRLRVIAISEPKRLLLFPVVGRHRNRLGHFFTGRQRSCKPCISYDRDVRLSVCHTLALSENDAS